MKPYICRESRYLFTPPAFDAPVRRVHVGILAKVRFGVEKLQWFWCGYPMMKKTEETCTRFDRIHERDDP